MSPMIWAAYGAAGAFVYSGPRFIISLNDTGLSGRKIALMFADLLMAVVTGAVFTLIIGPYLSGFAHLSHPEEYSAFAGIVGMVSNPIGPAIISAVSKGIIGRINGLFGVKDNDA